MLSTILSSAGGSQSRVLSEMVQWIEASQGLPMHSGIVLSSPCTTCVHAPLSTAWNRNVSAAPTRSPFHSSAGFICVAHPLAMVSVAKTLIGGAWPCFAALVAFFSYFYYIMVWFQSIFV